MADYAASSVFSSPSYWLALTAGVVGIAAAAWQEREGSRAYSGNAPDGPAALAEQGYVHGAMMPRMGWVDPAKCRAWNGKRCRTCSEFLAVQKRGGSASFDNDGDSGDRAERDRFQRKEAKKGKHMNRTCPKCKRPNVLSAYEAARRYQCTDCTRADEGGMGDY